MTGDIGARALGSRGPYLHRYHLFKDLLSPGGPSGPQGKSVQCQSLFGGEVEEGRREKGLGKLLGVRWDRGLEDILSADTSFLLLFGSFPNSSHLLISYQAHPLRSMMTNSKYITYYFHQFSFNPI